MITRPFSLFALASLAALATTAVAQRGPDFSKVEIKTTRITGNFYTLEGQGGAIGVLAGPDGVLMIDSQFAPLTDKIVAAIRRITDRPVRFLVNTHVHGDHTGGNENLAKLGVTIFARDELRARLAHPVAPPGGNAPAPAPAAALPVVTYDGPVTFHMNGEEVELIPIRHAHTDGDTLVRLPASDIIMTGDFFRSIQFPNVDRANGGSLNGMLDGLAFIIGQAGPSTKIIPGHGPIVDRSAVAAQRDLILALRDRVAKMVDQGMTLEQVQAAKPTSDYDAKVQQAGTTGDRFIGQLYAELKASKQ
jgi:glyoxylase-like metal-dependent hydrolase (beta-lactamase superfamily II)